MTSVKFILRLFREILNKNWGEIVFLNFFIYSFIYTIQDELNLLFSHISTEFYDFEFHLTMVDWSEANH